MGRLCRRAWDDEDKIRKDKRSKSRRNKHEINGKVKTGESEIKGGKKTQQQQQMTQSGIISRS